jgi:hypothetical protein
VREGADVSIDPELLELLACPSDDHAELTELDGELVCSYCGSRFPIEDGIPVLLMDSATPGPHGFGNSVDGSADV